MNPILIKLRQSLKQNSDETTRISALRFFKESVDHYGVKSAVVRKIAKEYFALLRDKSKDTVFVLCEELWQSGFMEEVIVACEWSCRVKKEYVPTDFSVFEKWVSTYVSNWAACDTLCNHTVGDFVQIYPGFLENLKEWARSKNRWMRRAAAVSLIIPAWRGKFLKDIFEIADILLLDADDLVQKGYGWMLKAASQAHEQKVFEYVLGNKAVMPRTALRYAIEKMPAELKVRAMKR